MAKHRAGLSLCRGGGRSGREQKISIEDDGRS